MIDVATVHSDPMEMQEFLSWQDTGGYGNKTYGDMTHIAIDLCQYCVKEVLGSWIVISGKDMDIDVVEDLVDEEYLDQ